MYQWGNMEDRQVILELSIFKPAWVPIDPG